MPGRVALVTGASSGMGRAAAAELCRRGARVMAVARREPLLAQLAEETGASYLACSLETRDGCEQAVEATRSQLGPIEIIVNNAALGTAEDGSVLDLEWDAWRRIMNLDLDVPFLLTKLAAADMKRSGWGRIIMVSSTAGQVGGPPTPNGQELTYTLQAPGRLVAEKEFEQIVVRANPDGSVVRLKDIARVELGAQLYTLAGRLNGRPSAILAIYQLPGSNALDAARE